MNLAMPDQAEAVAALPVDGVGLLRAEFMLTDALAGVHPRKLMSEGRDRELVDKMTASLLRITTRLRATAGRVPHHRLPAATSSAASTVGTSTSPTEENPMIGYRGCYRYVREPDLFAPRARGPRTASRDETPNLHLMIPFVRTRWELEACLRASSMHSPLASSTGDCIAG